MVPKSCEREMMKKMKGMLVKLCFQTFHFLVLILMNPHTNTHIHTFIETKTYDVDGKDKKSKDISCEHITAI
jgi:hypothetical protein